MLFMKWKLAAISIGIIRRGVKTKRHILFDTCCQTEDLKVTFKEIFLPWTKG
jgi:hypothetical protein